MTTASLKVLIVDDEEMNVEILKRSLKKEGFSSRSCYDGEQALETLVNNPNEFDLVLLDKMMPKMDGIEVLNKMKNHDALKQIPVIIQTGDICYKEEKESLSAGAYYYLTKPFDHEMLISLISSAMKNNAKLDNKLDDKEQNDNSISPYIDQASFTISSVDEATKISCFISKMAEHENDVNIATLELLTNAIEHGNINIGCEEKNKLINNNSLDADEVQTRPQLEQDTSEQGISSKNGTSSEQGKNVSIALKRLNNTIEVTISDEGKGFNWKELLAFDSKKLSNPTGRSICIIQNMLKVDLEYHGLGNKVSIKFKAK